MSETVGTSKTSVSLESLAAYDLGLCGEGFSSILSGQFRLPPSCPGQSLEMEWPERYRHILAACSSVCTAHAINSGESHDYKLITQKDDLFITLPMQGALS